MAESPAELHVAVIYARPDAQDIIDVSVPRGASIRAAIERSRILETYPEIDLAVNKVGVYGSLRDPGDPVREGDRIEIYRPLLVDPKEARRRKAAGGSAQ